MNQQDQIRAFALRCQGMTWAQIGQVMHYDEQTISKSLHSVIGRRPRQPKVRYPRLQRYVNTHFGGSVQAFARAIEASPHRLRRVVVYGEHPGPALLHKLQSATGLSTAEIFAPEAEEGRDSYGH